MSCFSTETRVLRTAPAPRRVAAACVTLVLLVSGATAVATSAQAQTKYQSAEEAWRVGAAYYNSRNYAASQEPLEAALQLAPDDAFRLKVYEALIPSYRQLPEIDKFVEASEFILDKGRSAPQQSLTRRSLLSFVYQRGKVDELAKRYEDKLKEDPNDRTALYVLSELYARVKGDPRRAAELTERLAKVDQKAGEPLDVPRSASLAGQYVQSKQFQKGAELYETIAPRDEKLAAWHWKEAASAWLKAGDLDKALAAAKRSSKSAPEQRSELLAHFWHRGLADVFLATSQPKLAIPHYEAAIEKTNIQGYIDGCKKSLTEARAKAGE